MSGTIMIERSSVDAGEVGRFDALAREWWDEAGPMKPLHRINAVRMAYLRDVLCGHFHRDPRSFQPLAGLTILDIGCGGGILSEPLARMGARVTGVDPAPGNIGVAREHAAAEGLTITYRDGLAEDVLAEGATFDVVLAMEVVEHVPDVAGFVAVAAGLVRPGGLFAGSTLNRTKRALALAIVGAEYILRWLPVGTHRWEKFVTPGEFAAALQSAGLEPGTPRGMVYSPFGDSWRLSVDTAVNYFITATRP